MNILSEVVTEATVPHRRMGMLYYIAAFAIVFISAKYASEEARFVWFGVAAVVFVLGRIDMHRRYHRKLREEQSFKPPMATRRK